MLAEDGSQFSFLEDVVVSFINHRLLFTVNLAPLMVDVLQVRLVLEVQMPRNEHILLLELPFTHAQFSLLLKRPNID
jgi:hypothetical protein